MRPAKNHSSHEQPPSRPKEQPDFSQRKTRPRLRQERQLHRQELPVQQQRLPEANGKLAHRCSQRTRLITRRPGNKTQVFIGFGQSKIEEFVGGPVHGASTA